MTPAYRFALRWTRTLHIYLTLFALLLLLFFAATGFMLNHVEWFDLKEARTRTVEGTLPVALLEPTDKLAVVERLRGEYGATGAVDSFEDDAESPALRVVFKAPGRTTSATIERADGHAEVTYESWGLVGRLTDLHRGKGTGAGWGWVIDSTCVFLVITSASGLFLWFSLKRRRRTGIVALTLGFAGCVAAYIAFVP